MIVMVLGLTGGSGTGKSTASKYFESKGFLVVDSDKIAHKVCTKGEECMAEITKAFGEAVADADGNLNRAVMREIVFRDEEKLKLLNFPSSISLSSRRLILSGFSPSLGSGIIFIESFSRSPVQGSIISVQITLNAV